MSKKVLIISSSPRKGGNSEMLAVSFAKGAQDAGHSVETIYLHEKKYVCMTKQSAFAKAVLPVSRLVIV